MAIGVVPGMLFSYDTTEIKRSEKKEDVSNLTIETDEKICSDPDYY